MNKQSGESQSRPDIVLIVADDLGFSDLGCYGGELRTPHIDALARSGVRMSQFYNTARCSPSRASLLTGKHPHQTGIGVLTRPDSPQGYAGDLSREHPTIAELLRASGWRTWLSGKWHLSADIDEPNGSWPTQRGFERFFGTIAGCSSYFDPQTLTRGDEPADDAMDPDFYYTDAISTEACQWIDELEESETADPFFLYIAYTAPHWPLHAKPQDIQAYRGAFKDGWDILRQRRLDRLIAEGILSPGTAITERDPSQPPWSEVTHKDWEQLRMEVYAAQVEAVDRGVGQLVDTLRRTGRLDNTIIVFLSDNGASAEELPIGDRETFTLKDRSLLAGARNGDVVALGNHPDIEPGPEATYASYGVPWANLSNTPFRLYKRWVHEGGIATPLIMHWPQGSLAEGAVSHTASQLVDILPTLLEAIDVDSVDFAPEGSSLLGALRGEQSDERTLYWEHIGNTAIRRGQWKLVREHPGPWELYDMSTDRTELHDLATEHPGVVNDLADAWQKWADRVGVIGWDDMLARYADNGKSPRDAEE
jgi:arylsulfatase A-like enzyme